MHSDTTPDAARLRIQVLRRLSGEERLRQAVEMSEAVRELAEKGRQDRAESPPPPEASSDAR